MKSKLAKRFLAVSLTLALSIGLLGTSALAAGTVNEVKEKTGSEGSIVVTVYDQNPGSAGTGEETVISGDPVEGVGINTLRIGSVVELTSTHENGTVSTQVAFGLRTDICNLLGLDTNNAIASQNNTYYFNPSEVQTAVEKAEQTTIETYLDDGQNGVINKVTGYNGVATFENLNYGLYLLAKSSLPADATTDLVPFLVSVPMYVESSGGNAWQSTVYAYPKVRTDDIEITKIVDDTDKYVNAGQALKYTVTSTIPEVAKGNGSANEFTRFVITDTNNGGTLNINEDSLAVQLGSTTLTKDTQYTVSYESNALTITLTDTETTGGLAELNKNLGDQQTVTVTYDATVATDVDFSTELTNTAVLSYQRQGMSAPDTSKQDTVNLYTYGIDLTKTLSDSSPIDGNAISFELYKTNNNGTLSDPVPVKIGNGGYWQAASAVDPQTNTYTMYVDTSGNLNLYGLEPGTYYLKETATMEGYTLLAEPVTIVITATDGQQGGYPVMTATVNNATAQVASGVVSLSVENTKIQTGFTLPQTGGAGTLIITAIGLGLLCVGVILLVVYRRKSQKNS